MRVLGALSVPFVWLVLFGCVVRKEMRGIEFGAGDAKKHEFQAETRKLLDIVARSLYTDKEVR